jgi:hypothetical protein
MIGSIISRRKAISELAAQLADQTSFVVVVEPRFVAAAFDRFKNIPTWVGYIDNGQLGVWQARAKGDLTAASAVASAVVRMITYAESLGAEFVAVITVPKTVPAAELTAALGAELPTDGSADIFPLWSEGEQVTWPTLFVDALGKIDPRAAAEIRVSDARDLS